MLLGVVDLYECVFAEVWVGATGCKSALGLFLKGWLFFDDTPDVFIYPFLGEQGPSRAVLLLAINT